MIEFLLSQGILAKKIKNYRKDTQGKKFKLFSYSEKFSFFE